MEEDRRSLVVTGEDLEPEAYPHVWSISAAFFYRWLPIPHTDATPPEYVYYPVRGGSAGLGEWGQLAQWNMVWESRHLRHHMFRGRDLPKRLRWVRRYPDVDFRLVPIEGRSRYSAYGLLYHLLPLNVLRRFGLPPLKRGGWPIFADWRASDVLPVDWEARLSQAIAYHLWPWLCPNTAPSMFSKDDPLRLLAHHLDFWMPYLDLVVQSRLTTMVRCAPDDSAQAQALEEARRRLVGECNVERPLKGGTVWMGEDEADEAAAELVAIADTQGNLRAIIDAISSQRVVDDFSSRWSWAREDFERKLYRKRAKIRPVFVELKDTIPIHGPDAECHENLLWQDFLAIVDRRDRRVIVCLRSGMTKAVEIAKELGYANHSPVSKALQRIRRKAQLFFDN